MASNGEGNVDLEEGNTDETLERKHARLLKKVSEICILARKSWEHTKGHLRGGHSSIVDSIKCFGERGENEIESELEQNERVETERNVRDDEQEIIEDVEVVEGLDDIDVDDDIGTEIGNLVVGTNESGNSIAEINKLGQSVNDVNVVGDPLDDVNEGRDYGANETEVVDVNLNENPDSVHEVGWCGEDEYSSWEESDSEDENYMAESESCDTEESVESDFEMEGNVGSDDDDEEEDLGPQYDVGPPEEMVGSTSRPFFMVGTTFVDKEELKGALDRYAITKGVKLKMAKSDKRVVKVVCQKGCPFMLYASSDGQRVGFMIKTLLSEHRCAQVFKNPRASVQWLAREFKEKVQEMPQYKISDMKKEVERDLKVNVSIYKCKRAKRKIMQDMEGSYKDEFAKLEAYCNEITISNPGSDVSVELSNEALDQGRRVFRRMYVCFNASKLCCTW